MLKNQAMCSLFFFRGFCGLLEYVSFRVFFLMVFFGSPGNHPPDDVPCLIGLSKTSAMMATWRSKSKGTPVGRSFG